jgi:serine/threonine protein kinase
VEHALEWEETLKQMVSDEKAKQLEVINEIEQARKSFTREAYSRYKTEMATSMISQDKVQIVDAILSKSRSCRRYPKKDIELATDNFSEERKIGEGGYGKVYRCTLDHTEVAVKVIQENSIDKTDEFLKEVTNDSYIRRYHAIFTALESFLLNRKLSETIRLCGAFCRLRFLASFAIPTWFCCLVSVQKLAVWYMNT